MDLKKIGVQASLKAYSSVKNLGKTLGVTKNPLFEKVFYKTYFLYKSWVEDSLEAILSKNPDLVKAGDVLDIGANIGYTAKVFSQAFKKLTSTRIFAFEPDPSNFESLKKILKPLISTGSIVPLNLALGSENSEIEFWLNPDHPADHRIVTPHFKKSVGSSATLIKVPVVRLDDFCKKENLKDISLIKIDVQGFEIEVLKGATSLLDSQSHLNILFEFGPYHLRSLGFDPQDLIILLKSHRFEIFEFAKDGTRIPLRESTLKHLLTTQNPLDYQDLLAMR